MAVTSPGAVDYHLASQTGSLAINPQNPVTLMCWVNGVYSTSNTHSMIGTYNTATSGGTAIQIGTRNAAGRFVAWTWGAGVLADTQASGGGLLVTVPDNTWVHVAYTYDGTYNNLYINGVLINQVNNSTGVSATTGVTGYASQLPGTIGAVFINGYPSGGANETSSFMFDDVLYYNRALSADEILTAYSTAGDRDGIWDGMVAGFLFNEQPPGNVASNVVDYSGLGNNLTPIGTATGVNFTYATSYIENDTRPPLG